MHMNLLKIMAGRERAEKKLMRMNKTETNGMNILPV